MGIQKRDYFVAICDVCGVEFENNNGGIQCFINTDGISRILKDCDWIFKNGKWRCYDCIEES